MQELLEKIEKRRTFAIISHPDAGKTTLTEKLLLYGGAIHLAGSVKARKSNKHAVSDWMEIEKQRGISVTSSVLQFDYAGHRVNILDTPGHQDFSEDTYRTLMAADSAVMLIDAAKGVEPQTKKLFWVCHRRKLPIFTFVNKLDRYGRNPFDLMAELEQVLGIHAYPINWPIGIDGNYKGVYDRIKKQIELFEDDNSHGSKILKSTTGSLDDPQIIEALGQELYDNLCNDIELLDLAGDEFDMTRVNNGELTPLFFGSAMTNFGVRSFLEKFLELSPQPQPRILQNGEILDPSTEEFSAFVFKIQANMNPAHRDRIAFMRICSGHFKRGMKLAQIRTGKEIKVPTPVMFLAQERELAEDAYAGDIIGIPNHGQLRIGDTLTEGEKLHFTGIPSFAPELLKSVRALDPLKSKHLGNALQQIAEEGGASVFKPIIGAEWIVGVVGVLQFEVMADRIKNEFNLPVMFEQTQYFTARWVSCEDKNEWKRFLDANQMNLAEDNDGEIVFLARNAWHLNKTQEDFPKVVFSKTHENTNKK